MHGGIPSGLELEPNLSNRSSHRSLNQEPYVERHDSRYVDIAPFLRQFCSCCPCCCCLISGPKFNEDGDEVESEGSSVTPIPFLVNKNVIVILFLSFLYSLTDSLWDGTVLTTYLIEIDSDRNEYIGFMEAIRAFSNLLSILPVHILSERYGRSFVLKFAGMLNFYGVVLNTVLILYVGDGKDLSDNGTDMVFRLYYLVMVLEGTINSVLQGPVISLFADSVTMAYRSDFFVVQYIIFILASFLGPLISIFFFAIWGNEFEIKTLGNVLLVGMVLEVFVSVLLLLTKDEWTLNEPDETSNPPFELSERVKSKREKYKHIVPGVLFSCSFIISSGFGMTIRFFPLYFKNDLELSPIVTQLIYSFMPICVFCGSTIVRVVGAYIGRVSTIFLARLLGVGAMFILAYATDSVEKTILVLLFIFRMSAMNSTYPVAQSILMEFTDKKRRKTWKHIESLTWLGWAASAAVGGILVDKHDYTYAFAATAIIQSFGVILYLILIPMVPDVNIYEDAIVTTYGENEDNQINMDLNDPLIHTQDTDI